MYSPKCELMGWEWEGEGQMLETLAERKWASLAGMAQRLSTDL